MKLLLSLPMMIAALALGGAAVLVLAPLIAALGPLPWVMAGGAVIGAILSKI